MSLLCPACQTENASDATLCAHCAAVLPPPPTAPQRMSLLEQAMAQPAAMPFAKPVAPPVARAPAAPDVPKAAPVPPAAPVAAAKRPPIPTTPVPAAAPAAAKPAFSMPPLPPQPRPRRRSRTPWILAIVLMLALVAALGYEALQANGLSLAHLRALLGSRP